MARRAGKGRTRKSFNAAAKQIDRLNKGLKLKTGSGLRLIGEEIMLDVKASRPNEGVPVDTGALRSTGRVEGPTNNEVELSFGGAAAPYALKVHEEIDVPHRVGESRYLVRGMNRWRANGASVARALRHMLSAIDAVARRQRGLGAVRSRGLVRGRVR